jgi:hypothetical protein
MTRVPSTSTSITSAPERNAHTRSQTPDFEVGFAAESIGCIRLLYPETRKSGHPAGLPRNCLASTYWWRKPETSDCPSAGDSGCSQAVIVSVVHLDDDERNLVLGILLEERPPTKQPLMSLFKQARAFGVGVLIATQNPMDLDYRALSNAGTRGTLEVVDTCITEAQTA